MAISHSHRERERARPHCELAALVKIGCDLVRTLLPAAEESSERIEQATREITRSLRPIGLLLRKWPLRTAVHLAGNSWYFVNRQINLVGGTGRCATGGGKLI